MLEAIVGWLIRDPIRVNAFDFCCNSEFALVHKRLDALEHLCLVNAATAMGASALRDVAEDDILTAHSHPHLDGTALVPASARTYTIFGEQGFHLRILPLNSMDNCQRRLSVIFVILIMAQVLSFIAVTPLSEATRPVYGHKQSPAIYLLS